jgi:hypothetical protein
MLKYSIVERPTPKHELLALGWHDQQYPKQGKVGIVSTRPIHGVLVGLLVSVQQQSQESK